MGLKWFEGWRSDSHAEVAPIRALLNVATKKSLVRVHIENTQVRFTSKINIRHNGSVIVSKPLGLNGHLVTGSHVRLRVPDGEKLDLRLEVLNSHLNLSDGRTAFVCRAPEELTRCRRQAERFDTMRYTNLRLLMDGELFRLVDLSATGFKVYLVGTQGPYLFPLGRELRACRIVLGEDAAVNLLRVIPRNYYPGMVGCAYQINSDSASERFHRHMLESMSRSESSRLQVS
jgi:hypothetical protein